MSVHALMTFDMQQETSQMPKPTTNRPQARELSLMFLLLLTHLEVKSLQVVLVLPQ